MTGRNYGAIGRGLRLVFIGHIFYILSIFPWIGLIGVILVLAGLFQAGKGEPGMQPAFWCCAGEVLATLFYALSPGDMLAILTSALGVLVIYFVCAVSSRLLEELGNTQTARWGRTVWKIYLAGTAVTVLLPLVLSSNLYLFWNSRYLILGITLGFRFVFTMILLLHLYNVYSTFEEQEQSNGGAV